MGQLMTIWWRDIPAQVTAKSGRSAHKVVLHPRFQVAIDKAAMRAGKRAASDYIGEWRREARPCSDDIEVEAKTEAARLEEHYTQHLLAELIQAGGIAGGSAQPPAAHPVDDAGAAGDAEAADGAAAEDRGDA